MINFNPKLEEKRRKLESEKIKISDLTVEEQLELIKYYKSEIDSNKKEIEITENKIKNLKNKIDNIV